METALKVTRLESLFAEFVVEKVQMVAQERLDMLIEAKRSLYDHDYMTLYVDLATRDEAKFKTEIATSKNTNHAKIEPACDAIEKHLVALNAVQDLLGEQAHTRMVAAGKQEIEEGRRYIAIAGVCLTVIVHKNKMKNMNDKIKAAQECIETLKEKNRWQNAEALPNHELTIVSPTLLANISELWRVFNGVWSVECGEWGVGCRVCGMGCGLWGVGVGCGLWHVECGVWSVVCGVRRVGCGV